MLTAVTAFICNITTVLPPVLQKRLIEQITVFEMNTVHLIILCVVSIMGITAMIIESLIVNSLIMSLKRKIQEQLLGAAIRNKNEIIASKGAGAYMVSVFGDSEQIASLLQINIFDLLFRLLAMVVVFTISVKWSLLL